VQAGVCLLERNGGKAALAPASAPEIQSFLKTGLGIARAMLGPGVDEAIERVAAGGGWKLSLSSEPTEVLPFLDAMLTAVEQRD
jgi:hypothetical protein